MSAIASKEPPSTNLTNASLACSKALANFCDASSCSFLSYIWSPNISRNSASDLPAAFAAIWISCNEAFSKSKFSSAHPSSGHFLFQDFS